MWTPARYGLSFHFMPIFALPRPVLWLGLAGILPQAVCLAVAIVQPDWRWVALAAGCFYAAVILSFLGGLWWMQALLRGEPGWEPYLWSVAASLSGWALLLPWTFGWSWPGPSLLLLGLAVLLSPLVDRRLARSLPVPDSWLALRQLMATGLGVLTLLQGLAAGQLLPN